MNEEMIKDINSTDKSAKPKKYHTLQVGILIACAIFCIGLAFSISTISIRKYQEKMIQKFENYMSDIFEFCMSYVDAEDLQNCIETGEVSEKYNQLQFVINHMKDTHDIEYLYIVKPTDNIGKDNMMYVMSAAVSLSNPDDDENDFLGDLSGYEFDEYVKGQYAARMDGSSETTFFANSTLYGDLYSGVKPIINKKGETIALLCADISIDEIKKIRNDYMIHISIFVALWTVLILAIMSFWIRKIVVTPIVKIEASATDFVKHSRTERNPNNLVFKDPQVKTGNELELLSDSLISMSEDMKSYMKEIIKESIEKQRIGAELDVATKIQAAYLKKIKDEYHNREDFDIHAIMTPAKEVGGDFYDFFFIDETHLALVMADVSGKGIPAALFMLISLSFIRDWAKFLKSPAETLTTVNKMLCENNEEQMFVTCWMGVLDLETGLITATSAGHEFPVIRHADGNYEVLKDKHSFVLAGFDAVKYKNYEIQLNPGDSIFLYTDGVPEATNANNEMFGMDRTIEVLNTNAEASPEDILNNVKKAVDEFVGDAPQFDDLTMLCCKYKGGKIGIAI